MLFTGWVVNTKKNFPEVSEAAQDRRSRPIYQSSWTKVRWFSFFYLREIVSYLKFPADSPIVFTHLSTLPRNISEKQIYKITCI